MSTRDRRAEALDTLVVLLAGVVLLGGFGSLFEGTRWIVLVLSVLVPTAVAIMLVRLVAPAWASVAGTAVSLTMVVWAFAPGTSVLGVPTVDSLRVLRDHLERAGTVIVEEAAPITPPTSVVLLVALAFAVTFVLGDAVARQTWRVPLLGLLWTTMLVVPSVISMQTPPWWVFAGTALAWLWLWWSETSHVGLVPRGGAVITAVGGLAFALAVPTLAPTIEPTSSDFGVAQSEVFGRGINPMIELGRNLRQTDSRRVLTYSTDGDGGQYLKVAVLRRFDGRTWSPSPVFGDLDVEGVDDLAEQVEFDEISTSVQIESLRSSYLPVPYPAVRIDGLEGDWQWMRDGSTVRGEEGATTEDQTYTVTSIDRRPTADQVRTVTPADRSLDSYRSLPNGVPRIITELASERAGDATNDYDRMLALQDWLRSDFSYSEETPVEEDFDGNGLEAMAAFLRVKEGYCVHFASTLAVMGRLLDVPTRVAVGYAPGESVLRRTPDAVTYGVNSDDLHAWTEAYFEGIGWIGFDATPGVGEATQFTEEARQAGGDGTDTEVPDASRRESERSLDPGQDAATDETSRQDTATWRPALIALVVVALLGGVPGVVRQVRRRRRWSAGEGSTEPLWSEVADTARDLGIVLDPAETPRGFARRLGEHGADPASVRALVTEVERDRYAGSATTTRVSEARRVVDTLEAASGRRRRWLARIVPRSLLR